MAWITPKTNWKNTDYFNIEDFNRIIGNYDYLFTTYNIKKTNYNLLENKTYSNLYYANDFNTIENNIKALTTNHPFYFSIGEYKTFVSNGVFVNHTELNRIETISYKAKEQLDLEEENKIYAPYTTEIFCDEDIFVKED